MTPEAIVSYLSNRRLPLAREKETQTAIGAALAENGVEFDREVDLGGRNIIDFLTADRVGIEVKIAGSARTIHRQCVRYCETGKLSALILASSRASGFPGEIAGVPCFVLSLGRAWL
ncbi:MAG: hypothetical protein KF723_22500 [Rhizobiaceae bacterium]|nr:hypothetical protein [Rhizobiaceae bacterium]